MCVRNSLPYNDDLVKHLCVDFHLKNTTKLVLRHKQKYLANHVIETKQAGSELECGLNCIGNGSCLSVNYKTSGVGKSRCELNNKTLQETSLNEETYKPEFIHLAFIEQVCSTMQYRYLHSD